MERVRGVILRGDGSGSGLALTPSLLRATSTALVDNLAELHAVDPTRPGLAEAMIAHNLEMATQLTACIALAISANDDFATPDTDPSGSALAVPVQPELAA